MDEMHSPDAAGIQEIEDCLIAHVDKGTDEDGLLSLKRSILAHMTRARFKGVLVNVSAVSILGSYGAKILMQTSRAVEMMGAAVVFVGFRPGVAAALVALDVDTSGIKTAVSTADAFELLTDLGKKGRKKAAGGKNG